MKIKYMEKNQNQEKRILLCKKKLKILQLKKGKNYFNEMKKTNKRSEISKQITL